MCVMCKPVLFSNANKQMTATHQCEVTCLCHALFNIRRVAYTDKGSRSN